jgi:hypothetical protein
VQLDDGVVDRDRVIGERLSALTLDQELTLCPGQGVPEELGK